MNILSYVRDWLRVGDTQTPAGRALLIEQYRILTSQIPVLHCLLIVDSVSIPMVLPDSLPWWFRFGVPGVLLTVSAIRLAFWIRLGQIVATAEQALRQLTRCLLYTSDAADE